MQHDFAGKAAIVTGAGSGIGRATALGLAGAGARVACLDIAAAEEAAAEIRAAGGEAFGFALDVRDGAGWRQAVAETVARYGTVDILVNSAGIAVPGDTAADVSEETWDRIMDINA